MARRTREAYGESPPKNCRGHQFDPSWTRDGFLVTSLNVQGHAPAPNDPRLRFRRESATGHRCSVGRVPALRVDVVDDLGDEEGADWYVPFIRAAEELGVDISGLEPGERITRGEMARLTLAFLAESTGQLEEYRDVEREHASSSSSSFSRTGIHRPL